MVCVVVWVVMCVAWFVVVLVSVIVWFEFVCVCVVLLCVNCGVRGGVCWCCGL